MVVAIVVLGGLGIIAFVVGVLALFDAYDGGEAAIGIGMMALGVLLFSTALTIYSDEESEEDPSPYATVEACIEQEGQPFFQADGDYYGCIGPKELD